MKTVAKIACKVVIGILSIFGAIALIGVLGIKVGWITDAHPDSLSYSGPLKILDKHK